MNGRIEVAFSGNPNSGKTTIFNHITGSNQRVGNYPGVTVEKKQGVLRYKGHELVITDLPGTYSLTAYSEEEIVARDFLLKEKPDVVVDIIDASNLERNLYLAIQLIELGLPLVLAFNMMDIAKERGLAFDISRLQELLGVKIVETIGNKGVGLKRLLDAIIETKQRAHGPKCEKVQACVGFCSCGVAENPSTKRGAHGLISYGEIIDGELRALEEEIKANKKCPKHYPPSWLALKLLEKDQHIINELNDPAIEALAQKATKRIEAELGQSSETAIASARYDYIGAICRKAVRSSIGPSQDLSDKIDAIVTHRILGIPIFMGLMYVVIQLTFTLGSPPMEWIQGAFDWLVGAIQGMWPLGSDSLLLAFITQGILGGVGNVVVFLPNILLLFLAIAFLEGTGYMARAAFIMDRVMQVAGLHGKSCIPMLLGFGCSVPAIMATRIIEDKKTRFATLLVVPLMSCGARLPIYALIIPAFFPSTWHGPMLWSVYLFGIFVAIVSARILTSTILKGESLPFVMELPPYRMPSFRNLVFHTSERAWLFLKKAGTIILAMSLVLWVLTQFPTLPQELVQSFERQKSNILTSSKGEEEKRELLERLENEYSNLALRNSMAGRIGRTLEPLFRPLGFDWKLITPILGSIAAKEVFVAQLGVMYSVGEGEETSRPLRERLRASYTPLQGLCIMIFMLIVSPCMATISATKGETGSWLWALFQFVGLTLLAWIVTFLLYQIGQLLV